MPLFESELAARVAVFRESLIRDRDGFPSRVMDLLEMSMRPREHEIEDALRGTVGRSAEKGFDMWAGRKVVDISDRSWGPSHIIVPDIPGLEEGCVLDAASELSDTDSQFSRESGFGQSAEADAIEGENKVVTFDTKTYDLHLIFSDTNVTDKFGFSGKFLLSLRLRALEHPGESAAMAQEHIRRAGYPNYRVVAGGYAKSRACAKSRVNKLAKGAMNAIPVVASEVIGNTLFVHCTDRWNDIEWTVTGPLVHAPEIMSVYGLVLANGPFEPVFTLQIELELLDITVFDGITNRAYSPSFIGHMAPAGIDPKGYDIPTDLAWEVHENLRRIATFVGPVEVDGLVVGTAVRVNSKFLLVNEHVLEQAASVSSDEDYADPGQVAIGGLDFVQREPLSKDLFVVEQLGESAGWVYRSARIGEKVIMCYSVGRDTVEYSSVSSVMNFDASSISVRTWPEARPGTSGAAIIALSDGALLGIYSGPAMSSSMCAAFTQEHYGKVSDLDEASSSVAPSENTDAVLGRLDRRGLTPAMTSNLDALVPLVVKGSFVGVAARVAEQLHTTVDPDVDQLYAVVGSAGRLTQVPVVFDRHGQYAYTCVNSAAVAAAAGSARSTGFSRRPELSERVMILSRDNDGPYVSYTRRISHVGASGQIFHIKDVGDSELIFTGGVVIAERDGAVVGQFVARVPDTDGGFRMRCTGFPVVHEHSASVVRRVAGLVGAKYPALNPVTWSEPAIEGVFSHERVRPGDDTSGRYALIGGSAVHAAWMHSCMEHNAPVSDWVAGSQAVLAANRKAQLATDLGLVDLYQSSESFEGLLGVDVYSNLLDGFLGIVSEFEKPENFRSVCRDLGLLYDSVARTPVASNFNFPSRSSSAAGSAVVALGTFSRSGVQRDSVGEELVYGLERHNTPRPQSVVGETRGSFEGRGRALGTGAELAALRDLIDEIERKAAVSDKGS